MNITIREYTKNDLPEMVEIWNEIIEAGDVFQRIEALTISEAVDIFSKKSFTAVAENKDSGHIVGLYTLQPNYIGRCGHIANASYAVKAAARGLKIGEKLVKHSIAKGKDLGFLILQFNSVVKTNESAIHLYEKLGFVRLGTIPNGFLMKSGVFEDIILFYRIL